MKITNVLGFDYGKKRIGIATGQTITHSATPCTTLNQVDGNPDWPAIQAEIQQWKPQALIVGMPYHTDGSENKMTAAARQFAYELEKRFKLPGLPELHYRFFYEKRRIHSDRFLEKRRASHRLLKAFRGSMCLIHV